MKTLRKISVLIVVLFLNVAIAYSQPPPPHSGSHGEPVPGGGAPIHSGIIILLGLAFIYA